MPVISWSKAECKNSFLHIYDIIWQDQTASVELCKICKDLKVFRICNGKVDNQSYLASHLHQALPRWHRLWNRQYNFAKKIK